MSKNTAYRVHVEDVSQSVVDNVNIENGAMLRTDSALYMGHNGQNVVVYPQDVTTIGGWARYDDTFRTSLNKLSLSDGVEVQLTNNGGNTIKSHPSINFYDTTANKLLGVTENDVYVVTIVFSASAANANQTHLDLRLVGSGQIERVHKTMGFYKGNDTIQNFHEVIQYYTDATFVNDGVDIKIMADGGTAKVWDIIYFIQRTQNADFS